MQPSTKDPYEDIKRDAIRAQLRHLRDAQEDTDWTPAVPLSDVEAELLGASKLSKAAPVEAEIVDTPTKKGTK